MILAAGGRGDGEEAKPFSIEGEFHLVGNVEPFDPFIAIAREANLDFVLSADRKVVGADCAAAGAVGQSGDVFFLGQIGWKEDQFAGRFPNGAAESEAADLLRGRKISFDQNRG